MSSCCCNWKATVSISQWIPSILWIFLWLCHVERFWFLSIPLVELLLLAAVVMFLQRQLSVLFIYDFFILNNSRGTMTSKTQDSIWPQASKERQPSVQDSVWSSEPWPLLEHDQREECWDKWFFWNRTVSQPLTWSVSWPGWTRSPPEKESWLLRIYIFRFPMTIWSHVRIFQHVSLSCWVRRATCLLV